MARISNTLDGRCACGCGAVLDEASPSAWFAGPDCHRRWHHTLAGAEIQAMLDAEFAARITRALDEARELHRPRTHWRRFRAWCRRWRPEQRRHD